MLCRTCGSKSEVLETRDSPHGPRRRRECSGCGVKWTTVELEYEGRAPAAVLSDVQVAAFRGAVHQMHDFCEAIEPTVVMVSAPAAA